MFEEPEIHQEAHNFEHAPPPAAKRTIWERMGAGSLTISILFHAILIAIGAIWIYTIIPPAEKVVDFMPNSGGGGSPASESKQQQHRVQMTQPNMARVAAVGAASNLVLPEPDEVSQMTSLGSMSMGGMAGGLGGSGSGGGRGDGKGLGVGSGLAPGMGTGSGTKNPFGMASLDKNALVGTFYDLKQTPDRKPTNMTDSKMREELMEITRRGFGERAFDRFFKAPRKLYQTKLYIPVMNAEGAPAAFEVEKEVQPRMWVAVYRGAVVAPKTGRFRFVGECDDFLVVRFNGRGAFDYGYTMAGTGIHVNGRAGDFDGSRPENPELAKEVRKLTPNKLPMTFYKYANTPKHNQMIGGLAVGPEFSVDAGKTYPIEIMIGEIPGGQFSATLLIEEVGAKYEKDSAGFPILPLFRLDNSVPEVDGQAAPFDPNGPVWKFAPGGSKLDI